MGAFLMRYMVRRLLRRLFQSGCGEAAMVPLFTALLMSERYSNLGDSQDIRKVAQCPLSRGHQGDHGGLVWAVSAHGLIGVEVWIFWRDGAVPARFERLPGCRAPNGRPVGHDRACRFFVGHEGAHSYRLRDSSNGGTGREANTVASVASRGFASLTPRGSASSGRLGD